MDRAVIEQKLESLRRCLTRVKEKCPDSPQELDRDIDAQDIVTLNLTRAVQLCVDIAVNLISASDLPPPDTMGRAFDVVADLGYIDGDLAARLKKAVGFRNLAIHRYDTVDWCIVHEIANRHLDDFSKFAKSIVGRALVPSP